MIRFLEQCLESGLISREAYTFIMDCLENTPGITLSDTQRQKAITLLLHPEQAYFLEEALTGEPARIHGQILAHIVIGSLGKKLDPNDTNSLVRALRYAAIAHCINQ